MLLYGCEAWSLRPVDMRSADVACKNNSFRKIFNACWWESVKLLYSSICSCLRASILVYQRRVIFWIKMLNSNNLVLHAYLLIAVKTVSLAHLFLRLNM